MAESIVVTDGSGSFYSSRTVFQILHDFGDYSSITASSADVAEAKKMLLSRQARYSGLVDVLKFSDASLGEALTGASVWLAINADESAVAGQLAAAKAAGVQRIFLVLSPDGPTAGALADEAALQAALAGSSIDFTVMRTGSMTTSGSGGGLKLSAIDEVTCEDVPREDIYRFITEAITLPDACSKMFSLCPSADTSQLTEMRLAGCTRREEVEALLKGVITEKVEEEETTLTEEELAAQKVAEEEAEAEADAESEEEIAALFARAQKTGEEMKRKKAEEEEAFQKKQAERAEKYALTEEGEDALKAQKEDDDEPPPPPPPSDAPPTGGSGEDGDGKGPLAAA